MLSQPRPIGEAMWRDLLSGPGTAPDSTVDPQLLQALFAAQIEEIDNESGIVHFATEAADQFDRWRR